MGEACGTYEKVLVKSRSHKMFYVLCIFEHIKNSSFLKALCSKIFRNIGSKTLHKSAKYLPSEIPSSTFSLKRFNMEISTTSNSNKLYTIYFSVQHILLASYLAETLAIKV
jgi:hypothetical protein